MQRMVDVIGVAITVGPLGSVKRKSDQTELTRREVTLVDKRSAPGNCLHPRAHILHPETALSFLVTCQVIGFSADL